MKNQKCLNCEKVLSEESQFCIHCGQKNQRNLLSIKELLRDFFENVVSLDFSLFRSLLWLWAPAYLAKQYVSGKRSKYFNPFRLLILGLIIHIASIAFLLKDTRVDAISKNFYEDVDQSSLLRSYEEFLDTVSYQCDIPITDSLKNNVFKGVKLPEQDTFDLPNISIFHFDSINITKTELLELPIDSLYIKAGASTLYDKIALKQVKRGIINPGGLFNAMISNLLWVGLLIIFLGAFTLKILYIRNNIYYLEHIVVLIYYHVATWVILSIVLIVSSLMSPTKNPFGIPFFIGFGLSLLFLFITMKSYYRQGFIKTLLKFSIFGLLYFFVLSALIGLIFLISFFVF